MQESKTGRAVPQLDTVASALEQTLENEPALLDLLAQAPAKGAGPGENAPAGRGFRSLSTSTVSRTCCSVTPSARAILRKWFTATSSR